MIWTALAAGVAWGQELQPVHVQTATDLWGVGGGGLAGLVSAVLALLIRDKLQSQRESAVAAGSDLPELRTRVTRLELQLEALRDTQRDLRQLTETLGQLIRDLATSSKP